MDSISEFENIKCKRRSIQGSVSLRWISSNDTHDSELSATPRQQVDISQLPGHADQTSSLREIGGAPHGYHESDQLHDIG